MPHTGGPLKGYCLPLSPEGRASLLDPPPWHYGGDVLAIVFEADESEVRKLLAPPLEPGPNPRLAFAWFVEWTSVSGRRPELAYVNPERTQYREFFVAVSCQYKGAPGFTVPYIWVDNDFTLLRGWFQGFPKKLGRVWITKLHPLNPALGGVREGVRLTGICESHGERIAAGTVEVARRAAVDELPKPKFYLIRHFPNIEDPARPSVHELVESVVKDVRFGDVWGGPASLTINESELEEVDRLRPVRVLGGYYFSVGFTIEGGRVLHKY
ncbi:MAG: acetoacetate decarboxylase family protein [Candidatus Nezhaarchaeales archaeon]